MKALAIAGMLVAFGAQAEDAPAPCAAVGLAPDAVARLARGSQCRLDPTAVTCRPGLTLAADQHGPRDLCLARDGRPVDRPHCLAARARLYQQIISSRQVRVVESRDGSARPRLVEIPHVEAARAEILVDREPLIRSGRDACVFARLPRVVQQAPKTKGPERRRRGTTATPLASQ
ncbi:MAG: hypothetical protein KC620_16415 [Myxococcales bacterium]|nr:hypothetical protein [Myxococcales bacterium]